MKKILGLVVACACGIVFVYSFMGIVRIERLLLKQQFSGHLVDATSAWARERGRRNRALWLDEPVTDEELKSIQNEGNDGDESIKLAMESRWYQKSDFIKRVAFEKNLEEFDTLRVLIDSELKKNGEERNQKDMLWFEMSTNLIASADDLVSYDRSSGVKAKSGGLHTKVDEGNSLRHDVWRISELAGRERAIIAGVLSNQVGPSKRQQQDLDENRKKLDLLWSSVQQNYGTVLSSLQQGIGLWELDKARGLYFGEFELYRQSVLSKFNDPSYEASHNGDWFDLSTNAINSILDLETFVNTVIFNQETAAQLQQKKFVSIATFAAVLLMLYFTTISIHSVRDVARNRSLANKWITICKASSELLKCVGDWAFERGVVQGAIWAKNSEVRDSLSGHISDLTQKRPYTANDFVNALEKIRDEQIVGQDQQIVIVEDNFSVILCHRSKFEFILRQDFDADCKECQELRDVWRASITKLIKSVEDLHLVSLNAGMAYAPVTDMPFGDLVALKHFIWIMSEFSGRERALVAGAIASGERHDGVVRNNGKSFDDELSEIRVRVEEAMEVLSDILKTESESCGPWGSELQEVARSVIEFRKGFVGRQDEYMACIDGDSANLLCAWITDSTDVINGIIELSETVDEVIGKNVTFEEDHRNGMLFIVAWVLLLGVCICAFIGVRAGAVQWFV